MMARRPLIIALLSGTAAQEPRVLPPWHRFATNANYRLTALIDVNGGASASNSASFDVQQARNTERTPGYTIPIDVVTLYDPAAGTYHQRVSYYSGTTVEYNVDGTGYSVVPTPYAHELGVKGTNVCFYQGDNETEKQPYLNFFPTVEQMENYTLGKLITTNAGIPYRIATLKAPHGTHDAIQSDSSEQPNGYENGMPPVDWFEILYQESLSTGAVVGSKNYARPLKWTMLARNQIINAHTEHWVLHYLSYEAIDTEDEKKLWSDWLQMNFNSDCSDGRRVKFAENHSLKTNRLGMFFSSSFGHGRAPQKANPTPFDAFLMLHNKQYSTDEEYTYRKSIHDSNMDKIQMLNQAHAGRTSFAHNEFLDLELEEVMKFRGGHIPNANLDKARKAAINNSKSRASYLRRLAEDDEEAIENYSFNVYQVPDDFDPSTLPREFDWRTHLPGSVSPIKDQGFCGSCWAFSFISALESHWFITNSQSVILPEQFVNDCLWTNYSSACDGGQSSVAAVAVLKRFGGMVPTHAVYGGYLSVDGQCYVDILAGLGMLHGNRDSLSSTQSASSASSSTVRLLDWTILPERDEVSVKHALINRGPLSVGFNVVDESLYYANGVLDVESCTANEDDHLDHAVNLIGWGVDTLEDGTEAQHWILRNSWSTVWGDGGYFRVRMGERDCGVSTSAGFPVVEQIAHETAVA
ncbi:hypothetical protein ACHAW6_006863 [Cyclotella cf. meneghiniana]